MTITTFPTMTDAESPGPVLTALVLGASGLVGRQCLRRLLDSGAYRRVTVLTRRSLGVQHPCLHEIMADPLVPQDHSDAFQVDHVFCALGTTLRQAGSRAAFRHVDEALVVQAGQLAVVAGVRRFMVVSALNANPRSPFFYARVKGQMERQLAQAGLPLLVFMQPSLLLGERDRRRSAEALGGWLYQKAAPAAAWSRASWLPVSAGLVAEAMLGMALTGPSSGIYRLRYRDFLIFSRAFRQRWSQPLATAHDSISRKA